MSAIRILGGLAAVAFFAFSARRYSRRQISKRNLLISFAITVAVVTLAISPSLFDPVIGLFVEVRPRSNRRFTFVLLVAVIVQFFLLLRAQASSDWNERSLRLLVEALGRERFDWAEAGELPEGRRIVTVSPAYNEAENVAAVIHAIPEKVDVFHVIPVVVSDGSEDRTAEVARGAGALVAELPIRRGGGLALRVGYEIALKLDAEIVVTLDADGQHLPEEIPRLLEAASAAELVLGTRAHFFAEMSWLRSASNRLSSWAISAVAGRDLPDIQTGFRLYTRSLFEATGFPEKRFDAESAVVVRAARRGLRIVPVPVRLGFADGRTTSHYRPVVDSLRIARAVVRARWERPPR
jgi:hypothetical protein